ncbi:MAG: hypothetical protein IPN44_05055 [Flavobacteriales bacterium]|nr:hypothetical protein [Flavobacteriales bacterium]
MRLGNDFRCSISADHVLIEEEPLIPSLMVQPFVDNATWHGLAPRSGRKRLDVAFKERNVPLVVRRAEHELFGALRS